MKTKVTVALLVLCLVLAAVTVSYAKNGAMRVSEAIWANGDIYDTIITPTTFVFPPEHSTDMIYSFMMSGLEGQRSVAESTPKNPDYNGGRWDVQMVVFTAQGMAAHDPDGDGTVNFELTSAEQVLEHEGLGHIIINDANFYFECPLLPRRGR